ncbi:MAG: nuoN [Sphingomonadales bacterium]|nr:nuoN [Sphingomonadales bacterium]
MNQLLLTSPELTLSIGAIVLMLVAAWQGDKATNVISWAAVGLLLLAGLSLLGPAGKGGVAFNGLYRADAFGTFAKVLIYATTAVCIIVAPRFFGGNGVAHERLRAEYPVLILLATAGGGMMVSATDLLTLYIGLELQSLASYVLASFMRRDTRSAEAGLKYFVLGALASGILLYGISLVYGFTGTTGYEGIARAFGAGLTTGQLFGLVFVFAGIAFKIAAVPFHMWTPDVYEGAPTPVTMLFATAQKVAAIGLLIRVSMEAMGSATHDWQQIVIFASLASIILGAVGAIGQTNIKRLLAYSSINNVGFALVGLAAGTREGASAMLTYMAIYVVMTLGSFLCVLQMRDTDGNHVESIASLSGLSQRRKGLAAALAIFMFSLAGIPPLFGFWAKFVVFDAAVGAGLTPLAAIGIASSVIGAFYYLKIIKTMYFDKPAVDFAPAVSRLENGLIAIFAAFIVLGYVAIPWLGAWSNTAAGALF